VRVVCFSSFTFNYLDRARVLFASLKKHHPDWHLIGLMTDELPLGVHFDPNEEIFEVVYSNDLGLSNYRSWLFKHDIVEACTAVKGPFLRLLCESNRYDVALYLDPDTCVFNRLDPILDLLQTYDILLTPHILSPETTPEAIEDNEITPLWAGIYNLGFVAVRTTGEGAAFANWWADRLTSYCYDDVGRGLFVDQRWCDHVPALFDAVHILRDPGYNVASWNISRRTVSIRHDGEIYVNEVPLRFWHFTKLGPLGDLMTKKYAGANFQVHEIWRWYRQQVAAARLVGCPKGYWSYSHFADGAAIRKPVRLFYRGRRDLQAAFQDPFASGAGSFQSWLAAETSLLSETG
jgi:hypothetical protein